MGSKPSILVACAHSADFIWRAGGAIALYAERIRIVNSPINRDLRFAATPRAGSPLRYDRLCLSGSGFYDCY
jgi:hypothetical protein